MVGLVLVCLGLALAGDPIELSRDVEEIQKCNFAMPLQFDAARKDKIACVGLFVSDDKGKTWKHQKDYTTSDEQVKFTAPQDGLYWFALLIVFHDGMSEPAKLTDLTPAMKVYVNTARKVLKVRKTNEELQRQVEELRQTVEQLKNRIKELESDRKPK